MKFWVSGVDLKKYSHTWQLRFFLFWRWCQKAVEIRRVRIGARVAELADALDLGSKFKGKHNYKNISLISYVARENWKLSFQ